MSKVPIENMIKNIFILIAGVLACYVMSAHSFISSDADISINHSIEKGVDHSLWNELLQKYVNDDGKVNYRGFIDEKEKLDQYLGLLENTPPQSEWSRHEKMAFWINTYNAYTIKLITEHYPVKSILDIDNGKPWSRKWIKIGNNEYSLDDIEHQIIRPSFQDARIHFAVNCAARSCPKLLNRAWTTENIAEMLDQMTHSFINNKIENTISAKSLKLSKIFEWYRDDFDNLIDFINDYSMVNISSRAKITYNDYDWSLNEQ